MPVRSPASKATLSRWSVALVAASGALVAACQRHDTGAAPPPDPARAAPTAPAPLPPPVPHASAVPLGGILPHQPFDGDALAWRGRSVGAVGVADASKGRPYRIAVFQDVGQPTVNRVKVDADRDGIWDDELTFAPGSALMQRAPAGDGKLIETYRWTGSGWRRIR